MITEEAAMKSNEFYYTNYDKIKKKQDQSLLKPGFVLYWQAAARTRCLL